MFSPENAFSDWHLSGFGNSPAFLFEDTESTHSLMKARATTGDITPGTLIVADRQTAGRGRHERTWDSPAGQNLYFNILIPLDGIPLASAAQITQVAALTFAEVFKCIQDDANTQGLGNKSLGKVSVKWPNDILCGKHKFCGILAEVVYTPSASDSPKPAIYMGVGINVNSSPLDYAHLGRAVTTLKDICGQKINREKLLQMLIGNLERAIGQFRAFGAHERHASPRQGAGQDGHRQWSERPGRLPHRSQRPSPVLLDNEPGHHLGQGGTRLPGPRLRRAVQIKLSR